MRVPILDLQALAVVREHHEEVRARFHALAGPERFEQAGRQREQPEEFQSDARGAKAW